MNLEHRSKAELVEEIDRRSRLYAAIAECAERFAEARDLVEVLKETVPVIKEQMGLDRIGFFLLDDDQEQWRGAYGTNKDGSLRDERDLVLPVDPRTPMARALAGQSDEFFTEDYEKEFPEDDFMRGVKNQFFIVLRAHNRRLGAISVDNLLTHRPITSQMREDLRRFARYIALAIENLRLDQDLTQQNTMLREELEMRKKAEAAREALLVDLDRANSNLKEFAYIVSHDLKAPLRGITSLATWINEDYAEVLDDAGREKLQLLIGRTRRMHDLIEGVLQYSRVGRVRAQPKEFDTAEVIAHVVDALSPPDSISIKVISEFPRITYDIIQMEQVFQNLIGNAIVHMGCPDGSIQIGCEDVGQYWEFYVQDDGQGIKEEHLERIFKAFQTLRPRDEAECAGIGLAVVRKIVELNGGQVWVESKPGSGSTFRFTVPKNVSTEKITQ